MKNIVFWIGVKSTDSKVISKHKYGDYSWMEYSKKTWQYWAKKNNCYFVHYDTTSDPDIIKHKVNWQRWFDAFEFIKSKGIKDYGQILLTDASIMVKWDAPDLFQYTDNKFCALRGTENFTWSYASMQGYQDMFPETQFRPNDYIASGFCIFNKSHANVINDLKKFYYSNYDTVIDKEDVSVKRGRDQPVINYMLRKHNIDIKYLPFIFGVSHLYRHDVLKHNWQLNEDSTPYFIKYFYTWIFSGWPDRGETRQKLMSETWDIVKDNYDEKYIAFDKILDEVKHKDAVKYTTSRKFKRDVLSVFYNDTFKEKTVVEIGASQGQSTRILSHIFKKVIAVEWDDWNIEQAKKYNIGRDNIEFVKMDLYTDKWEDYLPSDVDVVFIDAGHQYLQVKMDIENSQRVFNNPVFIFDDYGLRDSGSGINEVKKAIDEKINNKELTLYKFIGETPEDLVHAGGTKFTDMEGCICNFKK